MLFVVDLDSLELISAATDRSPVVSVQGKRGDETPFEVIFVRSGVAEELPTSTVLTFGAKPAGKYDDAAVVLSSDFTLSGTGTAAKYLGSPSFNTAELNALFLIDEDETNDPAYIDLMAEFTWQIGSGAPTSTKTFAFRVHNDVVRDAELDPTPLPTATAASTYAPLTILQIEVTGSLTSDGSQMVGPAAPLVYTGDGPDGGDRYYCTALGVVAELKWSDGSAQWIFSISDPTAGDSQWTAAGTLETPISDLSWFPTAPATGTPVMNFVGPVFPNAKPSNASVNTAISASPSTTRTALGLGALSTVTPGANVATALAIAADATGGIFRQGQALSASTVTASGAVTLSDNIKKTRNGRLVQIDVSANQPFACSDFIFPSGAIFRVANDNLVGTSDVVFQCLPPSTAGYGVLETWAGAGTVIGTGNVTPIIFRPNRTERMRLHGSGGLSLGSTSDPGAGNLIANGTVTEGVYTVATTPTHSLGASIRISNATGATIGGVVAGTGSQHVVARSNGNQWICTAIIIP